MDKLRTLIANVWRRLRSVLRGGGPGEEGSK
jgi:hypothetical protein